VCWVLLGVGAQAVAGSAAGSQLQLA
jgi:hypothetical protein